MKKLSYCWRLTALGLMTLACGGKSELNFLGSSSCGDGTVSEAELCDDGNTKSGDGCDKTCQPEAGYACSGEPSSCAQTVGNGKLDAGEECDDGNLVSGDGCSASGLMEGSCKTPYVLSLSGDSAHLNGHFEGSTASGGASLAAAACGAETVGAGNDRVFQFHTDTTADVKITLQAEADLLLRVDGVCSKSSSASTCKNDAGAGGAEVLELQELPAGDHLIVVDGVDSSASGDFTLELQILCPLSNLKLSDLGFGNQRFSLYNASSACALDLAEAAMNINWGSGSAAFQLPAGKLEAGATQVFQLNGPEKLEKTSSIAIEGSSWSGQASGTNYWVCRGSCDTQAGSNVLDLVQVGLGAPALPAGLSFAVAPIPSPAAASLDFVSFGRLAYTGAYPKYSVSDWAAYFNYDPNYVPLTAAQQVVVSSAVSPRNQVLWDDSLNSYITRISTADPATASSGYRGYNLAVPVALSKPRQVDFSFRSPAAGGAWGAHCYIAFGSASLGSPAIGLPYTVEDFLLAFMNNTYDQSKGLISFSGQSSTTSNSYYSSNKPGPGVWQTVSLRNIDWNLRTFALYLNDSLVNAAASFPNTAGITNILLAEYTSETYCEYGPIVLRTTLP